MEIIKTEIDGVLIIKPKIFEDCRGCFFEAYNRFKFSEHNIEVEFVQDNQSLSLKEHTIRGMHYQLQPMAQTKLIRVIRGAILNYALDIRLGSPTFGRHVKVELMANDQKMILIPRGFANGLCTLEPNTEIIYKVDHQYSPEHDISFAYNDPKFKLVWPTDNPTLSERDARAPFYDEVPNNFVYDGDAS